MSPLSVFLNHSFKFGREERIVELLLHNESNPLITTAEGGLTLTHLHAKSAKLDTSVLKLLKDSGLDLNAVDNDGRTVLHLSAIAGSLTRQSYQFLQKESNLSGRTPDMYGKSPIQYTAEMNLRVHHWGTFDKERWKQTNDLLRDTSFEIQ